MFGKAVSVARFLPSLLFWRTYHKAHAIDPASAGRSLSRGAICTRFWQTYLQNNQNYRQLTDCVLSWAPRAHPEDKLYTSKEFEAQSC